MRLSSIVFLLSYALIIKRDHTPALPMGDIEKFASQSSNMLLRSCIYAMNLLRIENMLDESDKKERKGVK